VPAARIQTFDNAGALAAAAGARVLECGREALRRHGRFLLALSGGRTPAATFAWLVASRAKAGEAFEWARAHVYFADERAVPPDHPDSNFRMARETLIDPLHLPPRQIHRMKGEYADLAAAAVEYEARLPAALDLVLLGIGEDGHVASLFPGGAAVAERERRVLPVLDAPKPPPRRLTLTPRALSEAREVLVLATGAGKAAAVAAALEGGRPEGEIPARLVRERDWMLDAEAASGLERH
jgi:6-phosphogluconolactonase